MSEASCVKSDHPSRVEELESELRIIRGTVQQMMEMCSQLLQQIETLETSHKLTNEKPKFPKTNMLDSDTSFEDDRQRLEVLSLKTKLKELVEMNVNWQRHHGEQERHTGELRERIAQLEKQLAASKVELSEQQQTDIDRLILEQKHKRNLLEEEKNKFEDENHQLRRQNEDVKQREEQQLATIATLQRQLKESDERNRQSLDAASQERIQLLEAQLVMYHEDFQTERRDRERVQNRADELEQQIEMMRRQWGMANTPVNVHQPSYQPTNHFSQSRSYSQPHNYTPAQNYPCPEYNQLLYGRGVPMDSRNPYQTDGGDDVTDDVTHDVTDSAVRGSLKEDTMISVVPEDVLKCTNCHRDFTVDQHQELLEHMDLCSDSK